MYSSFQAACLRRTRILIQAVRPRLMRLTAILRRIYRDSVRCRKNRLPDGGGRILLGAMIRGGFLTSEERRDLTELARCDSACKVGFFVLLCAPAEIE